MKKVLNDLKLKLQSTIDIFLSKAPSLEIKQTGKNLIFYYSALQDKFNQEFYLLGINRRISSRTFRNSSTIEVDSYKLDFNRKRLIMETSLRIVENLYSEIVIKVGDWSSSWIFNSMDSEINLYQKINKIIKEVTLIVVRKFDNMISNFPEPLKIIPSFSYRGQDIYIIVGENLEPNKEFHKEEISEIIMSWSVDNNEEMFNKYFNFNLVNVGGKYWTLIAR